MFKFFKRLLFGKQPCDHATYYRTSRWLSADGTPMHEFHCLDCGFTDRGHVHGDSDGWTPLVVIMQNGVEKSRWSNR